MPTILLTGFTPFGGFGVNPSQQIAERLDGETVGGARVVGLTLPVAFGQDAEKVFTAIADHRPTLVLCLGLSNGAPCLEVERFAVNLKADDGQDAQTTIVHDGFTAQHATINVEEVARAIRLSGVPARAHGYAGAYLCNHLFYQVLHYAIQWDLTYRAGFIHLPQSSEQAIAEARVHQPSLPLETMTQGIRTALEAALE